MLRLYFLLIEPLLELKPEIVKVCDAKFTLLIEPLLELKRTLYLNKSFGLKIF